ncbi:hypothetical protein PPTG_20888 [Phytophthora nicotianae INRA-310]|uniref:SAP domain-containing protein n=1 Tax=Phytophthora nicotianae (strain INRA-310) TaxID=761204 RepID=W2R9Q8_PHYN3|nr:hypothetical protein PPTG_20888 [Phytophthora nicotianae INRA-310]ETN22148.1 hypothetical protein PPTG_20888 [Phytophthora nicotianae INRA-310]
MRVQVKDLQRELKKRGLDTSGLKAGLLQRLKEHLQQEEKETAHEENIKASSDKKEETDHKSEKKGEENKEKKSDKKGKSDPEKDAGSNDGENEDKPKALKRGADALEKDDNKDLPDIKKPKLAKEAKNGSPQPEDEDGDKPMPAVDAEKAVDGDSRVTREKELRTTLRIDNFVRPFTLNAVKTLVQELGNFVEDGFWMDAIKTHCFVTYPTSEINTTIEVETKAEPEIFSKKTRTPLSKWSPKWSPKYFPKQSHPDRDGDDAVANNGAAVKEPVQIEDIAVNGDMCDPTDQEVLDAEDYMRKIMNQLDHTAMEVSQYGEANLLSRLKNKDSNGTQAAQRQKVTIDEFFLKTETKPVLYYLPLTDEQVKEMKQRQSQQPEGQPRKRRHRGGRKRNRRARFRR